MSNLAHLVVEAKRDGQAAAAALLPVMRDIFPDLGIKTVAINTGSEVSLNSVNGILTAQDNRRFFFKFHAEEGETQSMAGAEYYRAEMLSDLGWKIVKPVMVSTQPGRQCLVYEEMQHATAYDLFGAQDDLFMRTGSYDEAMVKRLLAAEESYLRRGADIMIRTLQPGTPETATAPLLQLFSHRLNSVGGATPRLDLFYTGKPVTLPDGTTSAFEDIAGKKWVVNGREMPATLAAIIGFSKTCLSVESLVKQPTVISHGDDHNGNKFLVDKEFVTFDPAFAGRHPALLAPMKGTMHNAPLHPFWYYKPARVHDRIEVTCRITPQHIELIHDAEPLLSSPLRDAVMRLHADYAWQPLLTELRRRDLLSDNGRMVLKCAAFCCPFLAVNMMDAARLPARPHLSLFNLAKCVEAFHRPEWDLWP